MSDEPTFDFKPWEELSVGVRRNRKKMYNYIVSVLNGDEPTPEPDPTPTGTGTVTITVTDGDNLLENASIILCAENRLPSIDDDSIVVAYNVTGNDGKATLQVWDTETHQPTESTNIHYGTYYLFIEAGIGEPYSEQLIVDGDIDITLTLTSD